MTPAEVAERFHARPAGVDRWQAKCPLHQGKSATSLSIAKGCDGRTLLKCWAGCEVAAICVAIGLRLSDLFSTPREPQPAKPPIVRAAERKIQTDLRSRLTRRERELSQTTIILTTLEDIDHAIYRGLALAVMGELVQIELEEACK